MDRDQICRIVHNIDCPPFRLRVNGALGYGLFLRVEADLPDSATRQVQAQSGREWLLTSEMTAGEIVRTALAAILAFSEHEIRESFTYRHRAIFQPHFDPDELVARFDEETDRHPSDLVPPGDRALGSDDFVEGQRNPDIGGFSLPPDESPRH